MCVLCLFPQRRLLPRSLLPACLEVILSWTKYYFIANSPTDCSHDQALWWFCPYILPWSSSLGPGRKDQAGRPRKWVAWDQGRRSQLVTIEPDLPEAPMYVQWVLQTLGRIARLWGYQGAFHLWELLTTLVSVYGVVDPCNLSFFCLASKIGSK